VNAQEMGAWYDSRYWTGGNCMDHDPGEAASGVNARKKKEQILSSLWSSPASPPTGKGGKLYLPLKYGTTPQIKRGNSVRGQEKREKRENITAGQSNERPGRPRLSKLQGIWRSQIGLLNKPIRPGFRVAG